MASARASASTVGLARRLTGAVTRSDVAVSHRPLSDDDGLLDGVDNCPLTANEDQRDDDFGLGDACDTGAIERHSAGAGACARKPAE